jgi:hypothetical protein
VLSVLRRLGAAILGVAALTLAVAPLATAPAAAAPVAAAPVAAAPVAAAACPGTCVQVVAPLGATMVWDPAPYTFVKGSDGHVWVRSSNSSGDRWTDLGAPPNRTIHWGLGAVKLAPLKAQVWIKTEYGDLWSLQWDRSAPGTDGTRTWTNHGFPANGVYLNASFGVVSADHDYGSRYVAFDRPYAFVEGSDGNLWTRWWNGTVWTWTNLGQPATVPGNAKGIDSLVGALATHPGTQNVTGGGTYPHVFVRGNDAELYLVSLTATGWRWSSHGRVTGAWLAAGYGAVAPQGFPHVFFKATDGNLYARAFNGTTWLTMKLGQPPVAAGSPTGIAAPAGALGVGSNTGVQSANVYVKGNDGRLWQSERQHRGWLWTDHGRPAGGIGTPGYGAVGMENSSRPIISVRGIDGRLWTRSLDLVPTGGVRWAWHDNGLPG